MAIVLIPHESKKAQKVRKFRLAFFKTFKEFCEISSIHGIKYFHDKEINYVGKAIWAIIVIAMVFCANAMVWIFYREFSSNPIRMNIESDHTQLNNLLFPAVTICPPTMYSKPMVDQIFGNLKMPSNYTLQEALNSLDQLYVLTGQLRVYEEKKLELLQNLANINNMTTFEFVKLIRWNCTDLMYRCSFQSKIVNCSELFVSSRTYLGYCCSFNTLYGNTFIKYSSLQFGPKGGLSIILKNSEPDNNLFISSAHELIVHQNQDFPHRTATWNSISINREIFAVVKPTEILCSESFKALAVKDRQCLLPHEHNMRYFDVYNSDNCEFECRVLKTFDACGCVPFMYVSDLKTKVCDFTQVPCLYKAYSLLEEETTDKNKSIDTNSPCFCPNSCQSVDYDVKITQAVLQTAIQPFDPFYYGIRENYTVLHVFMNSQVYRRLRRDTLSSIIDLVGNLGSSFSLFIGMSMISILEIFYFFPIVLLQNYLRQEPSKN